MKYLALLRIHMGVPAATTIPENILNFYLWLGEQMVRSKCNFVNSETHIGLALDSATVEESGTQMSGYFLDYLKRRAHQADLIIVDLATPQNILLRGGILIDLAHAIRTVLERERHLKTVILFPNLPPPGDIFRTLLDSILAQRRVTFIANAGESFPKLLTVQPAKYAVRFAGLQHSAVNRLATKLICRVGHFKMREEGQHAACRRYFYDARYCTGELLELYIAHIRQIYGDSPRCIVLYRPPLSGWLRDSLLVLEDRRRDIPLVSTEEFLLNYSTYQRYGTPLLIVPAVYSGRGLSRLLSKLLEAIPHLKLNILAVLSERSTRARIRRIFAVGRHWDVAYFHKVDQRESPAQECKLCEIGIPESESTEVDSSIMLGAYDMWDLVREVGWKNEEDVPQYRKSLGKVPRFPELIKRHGPWLASKFCMAVQNSTNVRESDLIVVCPEEKGSTTFTEFLAAVFGITVIRIPRPVLEIFSAKPNTWKSHLKRVIAHRPDWYVRMSSIRSGHIVLLDEFNASGGTRRRLTQFAKHFGQTVHCYFSIVDWNPNARWENEVPRFSLYDFQVMPKDDGLGTGAR